MTVLEALQHLRVDRRETLARLGDLSDEHLERHVGPDRPTDVRAAILALAQEDDRRCVVLDGVLAALDWQPSEAQRMLPTLCATRARLRAMLVGIRDIDLDVHPDPSEWAIRETLRHLMGNEARFVEDSKYATDRLRAGYALPLQAPGEATGPGSLGPELPGGVEVVLDSLERIRDRLLKGARSLTLEGLAAPMPWAGLTVDVRFMLHRRATHERQHSVQILKILRGMGRRQSEVQMLLAEANIARGALESRVVGLPDDLLDRAPGADRPSVREILSQASADEAAHVAAILGAVS